MARNLITLSPEQITDAHPDARLPNWAAAVVEQIREAGARSETVTIMAEERMLTPEQVARRMSMHRSTVIRKIHAGEVHAVMVGAHHRIPYSEFQRFREEVLDKMTLSAAADIEEELFGAR